jgi:hypothetical protein
VPAQCCGFETAGCVWPAGLSRCPTTFRCSSDLTATRSGQVAGADARGHAGNDTAALLRRFLRLPHLSLVFAGLLANPSTALLTGSRLGRGKNLCLDCPQSLSAPAMPRESLPIITTAPWASINPDPAHAVGFPIPP